MANGVELCIHTSQSVLCSRVSRLELERLFVFISRIFPTRTRFCTFTVLHGVVVPHLRPFQVVGQIGQPVQFIIDASPHVVRVVQIKLDAAASFVEGGNANGRFHDAFVKPLLSIKKRHVQIEHESIGQLILWRVGAVDGHALGHHAFRAEFDDVVVPKGQVKKVLAISVHVDFVKRLPPLKHRDRDVVQSLFGFLVFEVATHHQRP